MFTSYNTWKQWNTSSFTSGLIVFCYYYQNTSFCNLLLSSTAMFCTARRQNMLCLHFTFQRRPLCRSPPPLLYSRFECVQVCVLLCRVLLFSFTFFYSSVNSEYYIYIMIEWKIICIQHKEILEHARAFQSTNEVMMDMFVYGSNLPMSCFFFSESYVGEDERKSKKNNKKKVSLQYTGL